MGRWCYSFDEADMRERMPNADLSGDIPYAPNSCLQGDLL